MKGPEDNSHDKISLSDEVEAAVPQAQIYNKIPPCFSAFINQTSQDKMIRSNKNQNKKRKQETIQAPAKKTTVVKKKEGSENSDESQEQPQLNQKGLDANIPQSSLITSYFSVNRTLKSKGIPVTQVREPSPPKSVEEDASKQVKILQLKLQEKELTEKQLQQELAKSQRDTVRVAEGMNEYKRKTRDAFAALLLKNEEYQRELTKILIEKEKFRLGEYVQRRESVRFLEEWQDGYEIRQVKQALQRIEQEREELEKQKREVKNKQLNGKKPAQEKNQQKLLPFSLIEQVDNSNSINNFNESVSNQKKEKLAFQLSLLQKEEQDLRNKQSKLEEEAFSFMIRLKKYNDEINCRYSKNHDDVKAWPLLADRYQLIGLLGKGGFSEVYKGYDLDEFRLTACKIHHLNSAWNEHTKSNYIRHALRENEIHKHLKHENIVKLYDTIEINGESFWYMLSSYKSTVLEYCDGQDLSQYLKKYKSLPEKEARVIIRQVLSALLYLSQQSIKIIHYDLKPQNILFHQRTVKLTDFGLCKVIDSDATRLELTSQGLGTYWYLPPECFLNTEQPPSISTKVDVWSVGVIMFEMVFGQRPFGHNMTQERIAQENVILKATSVVFPQKPQVSKECMAFIQKCLTYNMESRWDVQEAFYCPYVQSQK